MERRNQGYALEHTGYFDGTKFAEVVQNTEREQTLRMIRKEQHFSLMD